MRRKILSVMLTICMVLALMPQMVFAEGGVPYLDASGAQQTCGSATVVNGDDATWGTSGQTTWYVVQGNVTIGTLENPKRVTVNGDVHLILTDGCELTVNGGIGVSGSSSTPNSLTIYGQGNGTGKLKASAASGTNNAGIGGDGGEGSGSITINGGDVTAVGDGAGSGIGGGVDGGCDSITINGGTVTAKGGGGTSSSGIGAFGGSDAAAVITISGGTVMATGSYCGIRASSIGTISTGDNGHAVIFASHTGQYGSAFQGNGRDSWSGVIFEGNSGQIYGSSVTPSEDFTIPAEKTLTIANGKSLTIPAGKTLTNNGKIYVDGTFTGTADNLYYPLTLVDATASGDTPEYNSKNYGKAGSNITLTPDNPSAGYKFAGWDVSSSSTVSIGKDNTFTMPAATLTVTAQYKENQEPVISGVEDGKTYCSERTVTVTDNESIKSVTVNGEDVELVNNQFTLSPSSGKQEIIATDKAGNSKTVTVTVNDGHTFGEWQSIGNNTHIRYCTIDGCNGSENGVCKDIIVKTPLKAPTYYEAGHKEYWQCTVCQKYFSDADGKNEISNLDAWKAGPGKIDKLIPPKTDSVTSDRDGNVSVSIEKSIVTTDGKTEASITDAVAESILDKLASSESKSVVINVSTGSTSSGPGVAAPGTSINISLPESAVKNLAEVEDIRITIETDNGSIVLDKGALEAIASKSGESGTVTLIIETVEQTGSILKLELKIKASSGDVTDFGGGIAAVT
ncbi:MAG: hypothetical protein ACI4KJ_05615, partial [Anaerovoracaceae bacterium]